MSTRITYNDKTNPNAVSNRDIQATAEDFNEIKDAINSICDELTIPDGTPINATPAEMTLTFNDVPDAYVANVQASGTITCDATNPSAGQTFTIDSQTFTVVEAYSEPRLAGEVLLSTNHLIFPINIADAINFSLPSLGTAIKVGLVVTFTLTKTAPYIGADGNSVVFENVNVGGLTFNGAGTLTGGISEIKSSLLINDLTYTFADAGGDDPTVDYPTDIPVLIDFPSPNLETALAGDVDLTVVRNVNVISIESFVKGVVGNSITYENQLYTAGDITDDLAGAGHFLGGINGTPGLKNQTYSDGFELWINTTEDLTTANSNWITSVELTSIAAQMALINDPLVYKGAIDCSTNPDYPEADAGFVYIVSADGKIGGALGEDVVISDTLICKVDGTPSGDQATVGANWNIIGKGALNHNDLTNRDVAGNHAKLIPSSDSTTAIQLTKADGTTPVLNVDTTNSRLGIGTTSPSNTLSVHGTLGFGKTITAGEELTNCVAYFKASDEKYYLANNDDVLECSTDLLWIVGTIATDATGIGYERIDIPGTYTAGTRYLGLLGALVTTAPSSPNYIVPLGNATTTVFSFKSPVIAIGG